MIARAALAVCLGAAACDLEKTIGLTTDPAQVRQVERALRFSGRDRIDVLLVLDDSSAMSPFHVQLARELPSLLDGLAQANRQRSVRLGVLTGDLGAPGIACGQARGGRLQAIGAAAPAGCQAPAGAPFLTLTAVGDNLPDGQSLAETVRCMTSVGERGCGFEMPLEALARQLTDAAPLGQEPFVRQDALLVAVIVTHSDDCSAGADSPLFGTDLAHGPLTSFRCARRGVLCGGGLISDVPAIYDGCRPATADDGGELLDVARYLSLLSQPRAQGGIKDDPADVVLAGLYAPPTPFIVGTASTPEACGPGVASCPVVEHSCASPTDPAFVGDPALRIDAVREGLGGLARSICDASYQPFVAELAARIEAAASGNACLPGALPDARLPDCSVLVDGAPVRPCQGALDSGRCWLVDGDPTCPPQVDPRDGSVQRLRMKVVSASMDQVSASCRVLSAQ